MAYWLLAIGRFYMYRILSIVMLCVGLTVVGAAPVIRVDASAKPAAGPWLEQGRKVAEEWYPRIDNLLSTEGFSPPVSSIVLRVQDSDSGVGHTANGVITVMSGWIEREPGDLGLVVHEVVHVVQAYPAGAESWVTEGIADYIRWAIYEGKPAGWFPVDAKPQGYRSSYRVAAGFLFWLESGPAPGVVRRLNTSCRRKEYRAELFEKWTGKKLDELWQDYLIARQRRQ